MLGKESAKTALERTAAFHGRLTGNKEDNVVGHETDDGVDVTCTGCPVPTRNKIANGLFFSVRHSDPFDDADFPFGTVAQSGQRDLIAGAVMSGNSLLDIVELDQHGALL